MLCSSEKWADYEQICADWNLEKLRHIALQSFEATLIPSTSQVVRVKHTKGQSQRSLEIMSWQKVQDQI